MLTSTKEGLVKENIVVYLFLFVLILTSCSTSAQPTLTPVPTATFTVVPTLMPTETPLPPTETPAAASQWNGIPIMPDASAGDGDEESYVFTIQATPQQIQEYYELELGKLGWQLSAREAGDASLILTFTKDVSALTVSVITKGDEALVLLVK
jgi:hypothetical protein